ncbi:hypothetical protein HX787_12330 [Pseudomonas tolaasii]|uniref:Uncharacterized protein n=2 Tax=Pseudomonas tolaasii TaxID=29442 RepID=A0A7Y8ANN5_PSETO|nr:hypothetical protein [Pseudomonas tolaasii]KAB0475905.1 hypothetical protein F7R12_08580 [Pseudomonas tolaasii]MBW1247412.1 hypothetical protein [Pseudomonas tolaasii]MBY8940812.1 hypothetical protein [Pseudomonas tolaasii]NWC21881.1 hypothetical protein [Pseudomonas tolaasii]NWC40439.1 hypothetical protein [Pseudomonas tolaasii]
MQKVISALRWLGALLRTPQVRGADQKTTVSDHQLNGSNPMSGISGLGGLSNLFNSLGSGNSGANDSVAQLRAIGEQQVKDSIETAEVKRKVTFGQGLKDAYGTAR